MIWASKWAFFLLLLVPLLAAWLWWNWRKREPSIQFSSIGFLKGSKRPWRARLSILPLIFKIIALVLAVFALARPQEANTKVKRNVEGIDIVLTLDISDSMLIEDMKPENRLEASKETIQRFIKGRVSDRIGLVVFAGEAYTRVPLTLDYPLLLKSVADIQISRNVKMGTAIGVALAAASGRLKESTAKTRIVIFMTDGENNSGTIDPETAIEIAKGYGLKVYSIGMGKDGDARLPVTIQTPDGRRIKQYQPIHSTVNDELLQKMADQTGGRYYRASTEAALEKVFREIDRLEKTKIEINQYTKYAELFPPFLEWALAFYIMGLLLAKTFLRKGP